MKKPRTKMANKGPAKAGMASLATLPMAGKVMIRYDMATMTKPMLVATARVTWVWRSSVALRWKWGRCRRKSSHTTDATDINVMEKVLPMKTTNAEDEGDQDDSLIRAVQYIP